MQESKTNISYHMKYLIREYLYNKHRLYIVLCILFDKNTFVLTLTMKIYKIAFAVFVWLDNKSHI